jgi:hypothetical protein
MFRFPQEKVDIVDSDGNFCLASGCSRHDIAEKLLNWR